MKRIMFVCHGNICRSPMAEFIFKDMLKKSGNTALICSAATSSEEIYNGIGNPVYPPVKKLLNEKGIDCDGKRAVQLTRADYTKYDLFICMDSKNVANCLRIFGSDPDKKITKLLKFSDQDGDISDPWYTDRFETAYNDILRGCIALKKSLFDNI